MAPNDLTTSQIDRLGERLRAGDPTQEDLILLDRFRRGYSPGYERVIALIRDDLAFEPTGRPAKSTGAIAEKLRRETIRLSQMQDIAGCRFIVPDARAQEAALKALLAAFPRTRVDDRRERPSHGYRAVHVIPLVEGKPIEIQVRTIVEHAWAELSEKLSDVMDPSIKYGGGPPAIRDQLSALSDLIGRFERIDVRASPAHLAELQEIREGIRANAVAAIAEIVQIDKERR